MGLVYRGGFFKKCIANSSFAKSRKMQRNLFGLRYFVVFF